MKFFGLPKKELDYMATLDWKSLMTYLEKKYGIEYKNEVKRRLENVMEENIKSDFKKHSTINPIRKYFSGLKEFRN